MHRCLDAKWICPVMIQATEAVKGLDAQNFENIVNAAHEPLQAVVWRKVNTGIRLIPSVTGSFQIHFCCFESRNLLTCTPVRVWTQTGFDL